MTLRIEQAKGRKDRCAIQSPLMLERLFCSAAPLLPVPPGYVSQGAERGADEVEGCQFLVSAVEGMGGVPLARHGAVLWPDVSDVTVTTIRRDYMKRFVLTILLTAAASAASAADVGVSISIGQPGFYGQIEIGNAPQPAVIYAQPVVIQRVQVAQPVQPIYLRVPPGHAKNWKKHCKKYDACAWPVYFVKDDWYNNVYVPYYEQEHGKGKGKGDGDGKGQGKGKDK